MGILEKEVPSPVRFLIRILLLPAEFWGVVGGAVGLSLSPESRAGSVKRGQVG